MILKTDISIGEFIDKLTILEIKTELIHDPIKLCHVNDELKILRNILVNASFSVEDIFSEFSQLKAINKKLWQIEDRIREKEKAKVFDAEFIELARSVYMTNDARAAIKRKINIKLGSELVEEKSYSDYK